MIEQVFREGFSRYLALPVVGPLMDRYAGWLGEQQYTRRSTQFELRMASQIAAFLKDRGFTAIEELGEDDLEHCYRVFHQRKPGESGSVHTLKRFLSECGLLQPAPRRVPSRSDLHIDGFMAHLRDGRGYAASTVLRQGQIVRELLEWIGFERHPQRLCSLSQEDIEGFLHHLAKRMGRVALQKPVAILRNFLQFLISSGIIAAGLETRIDTPRIYGRERLPCSLPWATVEALLRSVDRRCLTGIRDYAILSLIVSYGLRSCDVVALKIDDIDWRSASIRICQSKTGNPLELPLTPEVGSALYRYLKKVPRYGEHRELFLRVKAPGGPLKPTAVTEVFQAWSRRSGLEIPFRGPKCLRHSYAVHLLRQGVPLKTIGDLLGHRTTEATGVYLRLAADDLREVALHVPAFEQKREAVTP
jgi:site-specific recombinase XerD